MNEFSEEDRFGRNISNLGLIGCRMFRCVYLSGGFSTFFFFLNILGGEGGNVQIQAGLSAHFGGLGW